MRFHPLRSRNYIANVLFLQISNGITIFLKRKICLQFLERRILQHQLWTRPRIPPSFRPPSQNREWNAAYPIESDIASSYNVFPVGIESQFDLVRSWFLIGSATNEEVVVRVYLFHWWDAGSELLGVSAWVQYVLRYLPWLFLPSRVFLPSPGRGRGGNRMVAVSRAVCSYGIVPTSSGRCEEVGGARPCREDHMEQGCLRVAGCKTWGLF